MLKLALAVTAFVFAFSFVVCEFDPPVLGGWNDIVPDQDEFEMVQYWAVREVSKMVNYNGEFQLAKITKARKQVVLGYKYEFTVEVICYPKTLNEVKSHKSCVIGIYTKPWEDFKEILGARCVDIQPSNGL